VKNGLPYIGWRFLSTQQLEIKSLLRENMYNICREKIVMTTELTVKSGIDPHMISGDVVSFDYYESYDMMDDPCFREFLELEIM
jgi:hypothetical protein